MANNNDTTNKKIMRDHTGCIRGYYRFNKTYYATDLDMRNIVVYFGMFHPYGGTSGEMNVVWKVIGKDIAVPQLQVFYDGWSALSLFPDLIEEMGKVDNENINDDQFCELLDRLGFKDLTQYENPNPEKDKLITVEIYESKAREMGLIK